MLKGLTVLLAAHNTALYIGATRSPLDPRLLVRLALPAWVLHNKWLSDGNSRLRHTLDRAPGIALRLLCGSEGLLASLFLLLFFLLS